MEIFELVAETREDKGKGASRRLRRAGKIPGVVYGADQDSVPIAMEHDDLMHHLEHEAFFSHILTLDLAGKKEKVVLKDLQRHPWREALLHIDLLRIKETEKLVMNIPVHFTNEDKCVGVKTGGGVVHHIVTELEVSCLPKDLPEYIEVDILALEVGQSVHLGEVKLPEGVESTVLAHGGDPAQPVVAVNLPKVVEEAKDEAEEAAEPEQEEDAKKDEEN